MEQFAVVIALSRESLQQYQQLTINVTDNSINMNMSQNYGGVGYIQKKWAAFWLCPHRALGETGLP